MYCTNDWLEENFDGACLDGDEAITAHRISEFRAMNAERVETLKNETAIAQRILALIPK
jgi:hypothetical protein